MGSWNGTCGISQLPILAGRKVKAFLLLQSEFVSEIGGAGACYASTYFRPWFFPVTANYNDYGSVEDIEPDWNSKYMLETFQKWLAEGKVRILNHDEAEVNDPDINKFEKLEDVFKCVERGALVFKSIVEKLNAQRNAMVPCKIELKIGIFMVLDDIFTDLVNESIHFSRLPQNKYDHDHEDENRKKALNGIYKIRQEKIATGIDGIMGELYLDRFLGDTIEEHCAFKHYKHILVDTEQVSVDDFMTKLDETRHIDMAMTYLRKLWIPQAGQGSQSEELSFNKALVDAMNEHFDTRAAEDEESDREDAELEEKYKAAEVKKKRIATKKKKTKKKK